MLVDLALMGHVEHRAVTITPSILVAGLQSAHRGAEWICDFGAPSVYMIQPHRHRFSWSSASPKFVCECGTEEDAPRMIGGPADAEVVEE